MAYTRLVVLVIALEVLVTIVVGLGVYYGFSVFPYSQSAFTTLGSAEQTVMFSATLPLYMPSLTDIKIPYTFLQAGGQSWGITTFLMSAALVGLQSFVRGMYLGGLKGWIQHRKIVSLFASGRKYFKSMIAWSILQLVFSALMVFLAAMFIPLGLILMIIILFYMLTPYLIVLQDISFQDALAKAPRMLRRHFRALLPLGLLAMLCTLVISQFRSLIPPWGYAIPLLVYVCMGTLLIGALMMRLAGKLALDDVQTSELAAGEVRSRRIVNAVIVLLVPILVWVGTVSATGRHLSVFDLGNKKLIEGVSFNSNFSDVFDASNQSYTAYEWQNSDFQLAIEHSDLSNGQKPKELRGIADITWQVDEEIRTTYGNTTNIYVKPITHKSRLMYRLIRETAEDGSYYYSSMNGAASILPGGERPRDPLSIQMLVSGDGSQVFVLQYPTRFDISQVFHVSDNGRYLILGTSRMNPDDFHTYWFTAEQTSENVFELLAAKNKKNYLSTLNRAYLALACAMQEGDGRMIVEILEMMRRAGVEVMAPDWDEIMWTESMQGRYKGASWQTALEYITKAGVQGAYEGKEQFGQSDEQIGVYRLEVPFPDGMQPITYKESKVDGKLLSISVMD